jgi:two-component system chemotaxis response regulator CheB
VIRLLIVDDSPLMRRLLTSIFGPDEGFEVAVARDGAEAIAALRDFRPAVVTLDIHMPGMDGLTCLDRIMLERPCPVVMLSSLTTEGAEETLEALALGAIDFIPKPTGALSLEIEDMAGLLVEKVRSAAQAHVSRTTRLAERVRLRSGPVLAKAGAIEQAGWSLPEAAARETELVLVGSSTGGPAALDEVLGGIPETFPCPIVIAQHMPASFTGALARRLDRMCAIDVVEVAHPTPLRPGCAYIGRGDADVLVVRRRGALVAMPAPSSPDYHWHPSVDRLVASAMQLVSSERLFGVLLTGMGADGAATMARLRAGGGRTIAESADSAVIWGMPGALVRAGGADFVLPLPDIAGTLVAAVAG